MAITISKPNNIPSPNGNALAIFKDANTNNFFVVDINGKTESLERALGQESLQEVLDIGNSATQDMSVNGKITFGQSNTNSGTRSFIAGDSNTISSGNNFVIGNSNTNSGSEGIVIGSGNSLTTNTNTSFLIGKNNTATTENVYLFGTSLNAEDNQNTFLIGNTIDTGTNGNSYGFGQNLNFNVDTFEMAFGQFNLDGITRAGYSPQFSFGVGRDALNKENALVIWKQTSSPFANLFDFTGTLTLNNYGGGTITGTPTFRLGVDSAGNVIEITDGGGTVTSVGLTTGTTGTDVNVTNSPITSSGDINLNIPIASATNTGKLSATDWTTFNSKEDAFTKGDLTETTSSVLTITGGTNAVIGSGTTIAVSQATTSTNGYLSSTDWNTFNNKQNALSFGDLTETTSSILTITGGTGAVIGSGTTIAVAQADATTSGFLSSTDWNTFNNKTSNTGTVTSVGISSGGGLSVSGSPITTSGSITLTNTDTGSSQNIFKNIAVSGQNTIVADSNDDTLTVVAGTGISVTTNDTTDTLTITNTNTTTGTVTSVGLTTGTTGTDVNVTNSPITSSGTIVLNIPTASASNTGKLSSTDWSTFNAKQSALTFGNLTETTSSILTITGGTGSVIGSGTSIAVQQATTSTSGYLSSTDWNTFNSKQSALTFGNLTETTSSILTITGGTGSVIGSGTTIAVAQANASTSGFLSSTDWNTFNNKTSNTGTVTSVGVQSGITGTDVNVTNSPITTSGTITFNIPIAGASATGKLSNVDWTKFNSKIGGSGTLNTVPLFTSSGQIGNSIITQSGLFIKIAGGLMAGDTTNSATGTYAVALNQNTQATSLDALATGENTVASGRQSFAGGFGSLASGDASFSVGSLCESTAEHAFSSGAETNATGIASATFNALTTASGVNSFATGGNTTASGESSFAGGTSSTASQLGSVVFGLTCTSSAQGSFASGTVARAVNLYSKAHGDNCLSQGNSSVAMGYIAEARGSYSVALGFNVDANGQSSMAINQQNQVEGANSLAGGFQSRIDGQQGIAFGFLNKDTVNSGTAFQDNQFLFGRYLNSIKSDSSGNLVAGQSQFVVGRHNAYLGLPHTAFAVGNGSGVGAEATAFAVLYNGNVGIGDPNPAFQLELSTDSAGKPSTSTWTVVSDERIKENVRPYEKGLAEILKVETKLFDYNGKAKYPKLKDNVGVIAQEIQEIFPETISTFEAKLNEDDEKETELLKFDSHALTFALINSVKELSAKVNELQEEINTLKS